MAIFEELEPYMNETTTVLCTMGASLADLGRYDDALSYFRKALRDQRRLRERSSVHRGQARCAGRGACAVWEGADDPAGAIGRPAGYRDDDGQDCIGAVQLRQAGRSG